MPIIAHQNQIIGQATNAEALVKDTVGWTGKNLLKRTSNPNPTVENVTFTVNADNSITCNGTASSGLVWIIESVLCKANEEYILTGCPSGGGSESTNYWLGAYINGTINKRDVGSGVLLKYTTDTTVEVRLRIPSGYTANNFTFYPMIRKADITDPTYEPYHKTVEEELEEIGSGGHTIQNSSGTALEQRDNMQFKDMAVSDDSTNNKTVIRQTQVVATKAEWEAMTPDPNITYYLPWMTSADYAEDRTPIGTIIQVTGNYDNTTTPQKSWYPHLPDSEDYLLCTGTQPRVDEYPELANYFTEVYGSVYYFNDNVPIGRFAVPDFRTDFPTNGMLAIKAKTTSTKITYAEVDDERITENNVWSAEKVNDTKADNSIIAPVESGTTASRAYAAGAHFIRDGAFCTAKTAIAQGEAFTLNTNYTAGDIAKLLDILSTTGNASVSMASFITTTYNNSMGRNGNTVNIYFGGASSSPVTINPYSSSNPTSLGVIPEAFRPKQSIDIPLEYASSTSNQRIHTMATILSNGNVYSKHGSNATQMQVMLVKGTYGITI